MKPKQKAGKGMEMFILFCIWLFKAARYTGITMHTNTLYLLYGRVYVPWLEVSTFDVLEGNGHPSIYLTHLSSTIEILQSSVLEQQTISNIQQLWCMSFINVWTMYGQCMENTNPDYQYQYTCIYQLVIQHLNHMYCQSVYCLSINEVSVSILFVNKRSAIRSIVCQ